MITLSSATLRRGPKTLINQASFTIYQGQHVGLIGRNGCGKSSLLSVLLKRLELDEGTLELPKKTTISHLEQETPNTEEPALSYVLKGDKKVSELLALEKKAHSLSDKELSTLHEEIEHFNAYLAPIKASKILAGLGFKKDEIEKPVNSFSGGWRMRLNLAKCLMMPAELLLLDEPTNHLDIEACIWLERYLKDYKGTLILVSHDRSFLDSVCSHILNHQNQCLKLYAGNYSNFERKKAEEISQQNKQFEKQQQHIKHLMSFVERFRAKASKARQAQSRLKAIEKIEQVAQANVDSPFYFNFENDFEGHGNLLELENAELGYENGAPILKNVNFQIRPGEKIALLGANGQGKSTFVKTIANDLPLLTGSRIIHHKKLKIGYFAQHQLDKLDLDKNAVEHLFQLDKNLNEQQARNYLGGYGFNNDEVFANITPFSGGEKARLALALLCYQKPNLLLLDEPTNHFDISMRQAIEFALQTFTGALILVTHDKHLIQNCIDEFYLINNQAITPFEGSIEDYEKLVLESSKDESRTKGSSQSQPDRELKQTLKKIERKLEKRQQSLKKIEEQLADDAIYDNQEALKKLLDEQKVLQDEIDALEEEWLTRHPS